MRASESGPTPRRDRRSAEAFDHVQTCTKLIEFHKFIGLVRLLDGTWPTDYGVDADILEKPGFCIE